ncbi:hypothetical protein BC833DRAFT_600248 [Globomyces pollinis-pini]|nr:hypothetical protein BC833DRAFT_600248 [Globomyces pollinis-pini]
MYLAAAGIGRIGIVDYDVVESNNLQRQIIHAEDRVGMSKVASAAFCLRNLNSLVKVDEYDLLFSSENALDIIKGYDVIVDATDNVATRYLINDACVILKKPLVSCGALRMDGQLTVYNYNNGPCYRCIFPKPPPPETVTNCNDGGVLGVITGIMGSLQALEVIKIIVGFESNLGQKLMMFDGIAGSFRTIKLRNKKPDCPVCGDNPTITELIDYVQFCGASAHDKTLNLKVLSPEDRITVHTYKSVIDSNIPHLLIDVREKVQFDICALDHSYHIPYDALEKRINEVIERRSNKAADKQVPVYVICRLGNDSQLAVELLRKHGIKESFDIIGGLDEWASEIDNTFPVY